MRAETKLTSSLELGERERMARSAAEGERVRRWVMKCVSGVVSLGLWVARGAKGECSGRKTYNHHFHFQISRKP